MRQKLGLAVLLLIGGVWLAGCASTSTAPTSDQTTPSTQAPASTAPAPQTQAPARELGGNAADAEMIAKRRVYFAFDSSQLDDENRKIVEAHARNLQANPNLKVHLEGNCDERGTREYNLALGERRAQSVERVLKLLGVDGKRVSMVSYGEEKPIDSAHSEAAWAKNRRVEIVYR
ncbi:MAG: peptidoglycan-associated lipoprotein Pal [Sulfurifustaceae bacterium]